MSDRSFVWLCVRASCCVAKLARLPSRRRTGVVVAAVPSGPVSGVFLGGGRSVGPSAGSSASALTSADERQIAELLSELDRQPLQSRHDVEEDDMDEADEERPQRTRLADIAMFAQPDAFSDTLQQVYESDERDRTERQRISGRRVRRQTDTGLSAAAPGGLDGSSYQYGVLPPRPIDFNGDDNTYESPTSGADGDAMESTTALDEFDPQHAANVAALSQQPASLPPAQKKRHSGAAFAFSSSAASDAARRPVTAATSASASQSVGDSFLSRVGASATDEFTVAATVAASSSLSTPSFAAPSPGSSKPFPVLSSSAAKSHTASPVSDDSSLQFYYYDAYEEPLHAAGTVYLFGKALLSAQSATASCCVHVTGVQRNLFVLPRQFALASADDETSVTDSAVSFNDVYNEIRAIMAEYRVKAYKVKRVQRQYCFDRDVPASAKAAASLLSPSEGVPDTAHYLKLVYPFSDRSLPRELVGKTFSRVFGTRTTALELLLLKRQVMGPCWLRLDNIRAVQAPVSWCRFEYAVDSAKQLQHLADAPDAPLFSLLALNLQSVRSDKTGRDELVAVSLLHHSALSVDGGSADTAAVSVESAVCGLSGVALPSDWPLSVKSHNKQASSRQLLHCANERAMLAWLISRIGNLDPDALLAHDLHGFVMDLLLSRLSALKVPHWSKLGRLKRLQIPHIDRSGTFNASVLDRGVGSGRLQLDTQLLAKEFLPGQRMYTLQHLVDSQLGANKRGEEFEQAALHALLSRSSDLLRLVDHNECDCALVLSLMHRMQLLPLTKQLTSLAGNTWSRTLRSVRSERVEWLLLHEFHQLKFVIPEKYSRKEREALNGHAAGDDIQPQDDNNDDDDTAPSRAAGRGAAGRAGSKSKPTTGGASGAAAAKPGSRRRGKPLYSGGLVLEPKRGFYDRFILLLDFNSLYPSLIQEYNICFTTVKAHSEAGTGIAGQLTAAATHDNSRGDADGREEAEAAAAPSGDIGAAPIAALPDPSLPQGHLPRVLQLLVARRREVKRLLASTSDASRRSQLDIRQKALKLVANSMYGCLGFVNSRFYSPHMAALITSQGRDILSSSVDLCAAIGANVIYGDTDSIMIDTGSAVLEQALTLGQAIRKEINKRHRVLEIDIDGVYRNMLLLRKKKYAALKLNETATGGRQWIREVKGLDMVRRDWCGLSKELSSKVLNFLLSDKARDDVVEAVVLQLDALGKAVRALEVPLDAFVITKQLTKAPHEYGDAHNQPHVQVALAMQQNGDKVRSGDVVPYVVCKGDGPVPKRCYHPSTVLAASGALAVDVDYYLEYQVMPPVARVCAVMEELDQPRIAHALGLDQSRFRHAQSRTGWTGGGGGGGGGMDEEEEQLMALSAIYGDQEQRFRECERATLTCSHCQQSVPFEGAVRILDATSTASDSSGAAAAGVSSPQPVASSALQCPAAGCSGLLGGGSEEEVAELSHSLQAAVLASHRRTLQATYTGGTQCSDSACRMCTRDSSWLGAASCLRAKCQGHTTPLHASSRLWLQLKALQYQLSPEEQLAKARSESRRRHAEKEAALAASAAPVPGSDSAESAVPQPSQWSCPADAELLPPKQCQVLAAALPFVDGLLRQSAYDTLQLQSLFQLSATRKA